MKAVACWLQGGAVAALSQLPRLVYPFHVEVKLSIKLDELKVDMKGDMYLVRAILFFS